MTLTTPAPALIDVAPPPAGQQQTSLLEAALGAAMARASAEASEVPEGSRMRAAECEGHGAPAHAEPVHGARVIEASLPRSAPRGAATARSPQVPRAFSPHPQPIPARRPAPRLATVAAPVRHIRVGDPDDLARVRDERPFALAAPVEVPDPTPMCCAVVRATVEVLRGERAPEQLARWVMPAVLQQLIVRASLLAQDPRPAPAPSVFRSQVRRARVVRVAPDAAEATVIVTDGPRVRAAAVRLAVVRGAWKVVVLELG